MAGRGAIAECKAKSKETSVWEALLDLAEDTRRRVADFRTKAVQTKNDVIGLSEEVAKPESASPDSDFDSKMKDHLHAIIAYAKEGMEVLQELG